MPFRTSIEVGQGSVLFLVLSALYISPIFHIFEKIINNLLISISVLLFLFVDNGLFISQEKSSLKLNANLFCSYNIITLLFN